MYFLRRDIVLPQQKVRKIDHVRSTCVHVRPRWLERCKVIFGASFAGLFWALQAPCGVASNWKERHGSTPQICTTLDHTLLHLLVSPSNPKNTQFCRVYQTVLQVDNSLLGYCGRGGGLGSGTIFKNLMSPTPRRKWYLTTGRRAH